MAAQNPDKPRDSGRVRLPRVDGAMNRRGPSATNGGKGAKEDSDAALQPGDNTNKERADDEADQKLLAKIRKAYKRSAEAEADNRKEALDDLKHKTGEGQWPQSVVATRNLDKRPTLTINKLPVFVRQVVNEGRQNRPQIHVSPLGEKADKEVAKFFRAAIRAIERNSQADIAYDTLLEQGCDGGFGYLRILTEWEPGTFNKEIVIRRIRNRFTVYMDPSHQMPDGSDSRYCILTEMLPREQFEDDYPDADPCPWDQGTVGDDRFKDWVGEHEVRVAEYFEVVHEMKRLVLLENGHVGYWDDLSDEAKNLEVVEERDEPVPTVKWCKVTAKEVLDREDWPGQWIPIVEIIGNEDDVEGKVKKSGIIRAAKTPQQMYNFHRTLGIELTSLQPRAPYVVEFGQIEGFEDIWKTANTKNHAYLPYNATDSGGQPVPPPQRQTFIGSNQGVIAETQAAAQDFMAVTGLRFDATLSERVYDESGKALRELQRKGDVGSFHYIDNFSRSLRFVGAQLVDLIPKIYDTRRMLTILREDDKEEQVIVDPAAPLPMQQRRLGPKQTLTKIYNPTFGKYGVTVTIGPSAATKRIEAWDHMIDLVKIMPPQIAASVLDLVVKNADWDGAEQLEKRLAMMLPPNLLDDQAMQDVPPQVQAMISGLKQQLQKLGNERQQLLKVLGDQQADRAQRQSKIDKDFEIKLLAILQKAQAQYEQQVGGQLGDLVEGVKLLEGALSGAAAQPGRDRGGIDPGQGMPAGARQARDGHWYVPDPQRPGKWAQIIQGGMR